MKNTSIILTGFPLLLALFFLFSCDSKRDKTTDWQTEFQQKLPYLGHRNWILVVDKAFPAQSAQGLTTINTGEQLPAVLKEVVSSLSRTIHVKPTIYADAESNYIGDDMAKGAVTLQKEIHSTLKGYPINYLLHEKIFTKIDSTSKLFNVVILKTESTIAYSSIFIQLDCAYWDNQKEVILRKKMKENSTRQ